MSPDPGAPRGTEGVRRSRRRARRRARRVDVDLVGTARPGSPLQPARVPSHAGLRRRRRPVDRARHRQPARRSSASSMRWCSSRCRFAIRAPLYQVLHTGEAGTFESSTYAFYEHVRSRSDLVAGALLVDPAYPQRIVLDGQAHSAATQRVSGDYYGTLGVTPVLGRVIQPERRAWRRSESRRSARACLLDEPLRRRRRRVGADAHHRRPATHDRRRDRAGVLRPADRQGAPT